MTASEVQHTPLIEHQVVSVLLVAGIVCGLHIASHLNPGPIQGAHYVAVLFGYSTALAAVVGGLSQLLPARLQLGLGFWVAIELTLWAQPRPRGLLVSAVALVGTWIILYFARDRPWVKMLGVALGIALACIVAPMLWPSIAGAGWPRGGTGLLISTGVFLASLSVVVVSSQLSVRSGREAWLPPALVVGLVLVLIVCMLPGQDSTTAYDDGSRHAFSAEVASTGDQTSPNILIIVLDTVSAEHMSIYGYERETTPSLAAFLARSPRAVRYPLALTAGNWTVPSHASLFTGLLPSEHEVNASTYLMTGEVVVSPLRAEWTLAELLREHGYRTAAIFANHWLQLIPGLERGFDVFSMPPNPHAVASVGEWLRARLTPSLLYHKPYPEAGQVSRDVLDFIDGGRGSWFVFANFMEAHAPYYAPSPQLGRFADPADSFETGVPQPNQAPEILQLLRDRYDEEILALDARIGDFLDALEDRGGLDNTWLFITADHGEAFGRHDVTAHGSSLFNDQVHVPLIVQPPRMDTVMQWEHAVSVLDIPATISALVGGPEVIHGHDLRANPADRPPVRLEFYGRPWMVPERGPIAGQAARAVVVGTDKLLEFGGERRLFDLHRDLREEHDLAGAQESLVEALSRHFPSLRAAGEWGDEKTLATPETIERLKALGYVQ